MILNGKLGRMWKGKPIVACTQMFVGKSHKDKLLARWNPRFKNGIKMCFKKWVVVILIGMAQALISTSLSVKMSKFSLWK
jgi:hypothetical protein